MQRVCQSHAFQTHLQAVLDAIHHEVDTTSESTSLSVRLRERGEAITQYVVTTAIDGLALPALSGREPLGHENWIERGANRPCKVHGGIVSGTIRTRTARG